MNGRAIMARADTAGARRDAPTMGEAPPSPQRIVAGQVSALVAAVSDLFESCRHGERQASIACEFRDIELAYMRLGRMLSKYARDAAA